MNMQDMKVLRTMRADVENATKDNIGELSQEVPNFLALAEKSGREIRLELLEISKLIIDKLQELFPDVVKEEGWEVYETIRTNLVKAIMETRFAIR